MSTNQTENRRLNRFITKPNFCAKCQGFGKHLINFLVPEPIFSSSKISMLVNQTAVGLSFNSSTVWHCVNDWSRFSIAEHQERYREDCQRIFDVQNKVPFIRLISLYSVPVFRIRKIWKFLGLQDTDPYLFVQIRIRILALRSKKN